MTENFKQELQRFGQSQYDSGYAQGLNGQEYSGKTFLGYYGWCDGHDERNSMNDSRK